MMLFKRDLATKTFNHFSRLKSKASQITEEKLEEYKEKVQNMIDDFTLRFKDLENMKSSINFLINPFEIDVIGGEFGISKYFLPEVGAGELELIEFQEDAALALQFKSEKSPIVFWKSVNQSRYPHLKSAACKLISIFGTTYCCESLYSTMKFIKTKHRAQLTNKHLTELVRTALTNYEPDFKKFAANK